MNWIWPLYGVRVLLSFSLAAFTVYSLISLWAARRWRVARLPLDPTWTPPVTILKPVRGMDAEVYDNFVSFCRLDYPADRMQLVFGALDPEDPALALARQLQADFPQCDISIVSGGPTSLRGHNLKVCNLLSMLPAAKYDLLVLCDSDIRVQPDYLRRIVAPFREDQVPSVGLVTCPYQGCHPQSVAAVLEGLGMGADFIPSAMVSRAVEGVAFAFGSTIVLPRRVLAQLGGFEALLDELADDFRLGNWAQRAGYTVVLSDIVLDNVLGRVRFGVMWARRLRWARTVRACRPIGYAGAVVTHGVALALLFVLAMGGNWIGWLALAWVVALRWSVALLIAVTCTQDTAVRRWWPLLPISDLFSFALYLGSYAGNRITWRGERFRLLPGGRMVHLSTQDRGLGEQARG
jgi:ceramide glucosyltransferase